jgi:hypothetical protein
MLHCSSLSFKCLFSHISAHQDNRTKWGNLSCAEKLNYPANFGAKRVPLNLDANKLPRASFEVETAKIVTPNLLTFQLVTGYKQFYVMGTYIPPNDTMGVDALREAWALCPANCVPLVLGDLNVNFEHPRDAREEQIINLLNKINLVDTSQNLPSGGAGCRRPRNDGHGNRGGWGDGIIPSPTT